MAKNPLRPVDDNEDPDLESQASAQTRAQNYRPGQPVAARSQPMGDFNLDDATRAALMGFGAQMLQGRGVGQSGWGALGESIGTAGESAGRVKKQELAQQEGDSRAQLREAQASRAAMGSEVSAARASSAADRLAYMQEQGANRNLLGAHIGYQGYRKGLDAENALIDKRNTAVTRDPAAPLEPRKEAIPFEDWLPSNYPGLRLPQTNTMPAGTAVLSPKQEAEFRDHAVKYPGEKEKVRAYLTQKYGQETADRVVPK